MGTDDAKRLDDGEVRGMFYQKLNYGNPSEGLKKLKRD